MSQPVAAAPAAAPAASAVAPTEASKAPAEGQPQTPEQQAQAAVEQKAAAVAEAKKNEAMRKKYDLKVNGKTRSIDLDLSDDKAVTDYLQKAMAADEKFQEAATLRKDVQQLVRTLKENPLAILTHPNIGVDVKKLAEMVINQELEDMQKSPEQKKYEAMEKELQSERQLRQQQEEAARQAEIGRRQEEQFRQIDDDISEALSSTDLPKSPYVVKRISDTMIAAMDMGYRDVTIKDIMPIVEKQLREEIGNWFDSSSEDALEKLIGKNNWDRVRKKRVATQKAAPKTAQSVKQTTEGAKPAPKEEGKGEKKQRFEDLFGKF
jgi:hypothetical protein